MIETITSINNTVNSAVWGWPALILLGFVGVLMTCLTGVFQVSHFGHWIKNTIGAIFQDRQVTSHTADKTISQFQSLCTALAATVGTGNMSQVNSMVANVVSAGSSVGVAIPAFAVGIDNGRKSAI